MTTLAELQARRQEIAAGLRQAQKDRDFWTEKLKELRHDTEVFYGAIPTEPC